MCSGKYEKLFNYSKNSIDKINKFSLINESQIITEKLIYEDYTEMFYINGNISFFNSHGYLSADDFHTVDVIFIFLKLYQ